MKKLEWWTMYFEAQRLKKLGLKISQIARALSLSRNTVYRYLEMNPDDLDQERERRKKLDGYTDESSPGLRNILIYRQLKSRTGWKKKMARRLRPARVP